MMFDCAAETVVQAHIDAFNARDLAGVIATYAPDATVEFDGRSDLDLAGIGAIRSYYAAWFVDTAEWTFDVRSQQRVGDQIQVFKRLTKDDRPARSEVWFYRVADCRIEHVLQVQTMAVP